jgi:hypothetical protein
MKCLPLSIAGLALVSALTACAAPTTTSSSDTGAPASSSPATSSHKAEIPDYVLSPYTADQYPKLFAAFASRINDVERLRRAKDQDEFDRFMNERRATPPAVNE